MTPLPAAEAHVNERGLRSASVYTTMVVMMVIAGANLLLANRSLMNLAPTTAQTTTRLRLWGLASSEF